MEKMVNGVEESEIRQEDAKNEQEVQQRPCAERLEELTMLYAEVCQLSLQLEEFEVSPSPTDVPQMDMRRILAGVEQNFKKKETWNALKKSLPPRDLLSRRCQTWAGYLYPRVREYHVSQLRAMDLRRKLDRLLILQTEKWTKVPMRNEKNPGSAESLLGYWNRQILAFRDRFNNYKAEFEAEQQEEYGDDWNDVFAEVKYEQEEMVESLEFTTVRLDRRFDIVIKLDCDIAEISCSVAVEGLEAWVKRCLRTKSSVSYLMHGLGLGESEGLWAIIDRQFGGDEQLLAKELEYTDVFSP